MEDLAVEGPCRVSRADALPLDVVLLFRMNTTRKLSAAKASV